MIQLIEPIRGVTLVQNLNTIMIGSPILSNRAPILADIFVFSYPVYLLGLYTWGWIKKTIPPKVSALIIGVNVAITVIINIGIQFFIEKARPNIVLGLVDQKQETLLHRFLPSSSFPSDHAAVSMSIAIASILQGIIYKDTKYIWFGVIGVIFSIIMGSARIMTAVHRPTDIVGGVIVGIAIPSLLALPQIHRQLKKPLTRIAQKI